jgi:2-oxoglutarate dehydrogenase complex dehydrogenase (E1) component-like enzyme|tara:strand:+ start:2729 stop:2857 length:129 start_codon:yes stop_codon:yes gene_type:complete
MNINSTETIEYLNHRVEALVKENKFLKEQLNHCLTQLDLDNE